MQGTEIIPFDNAVHRQQVINLWQSVFGYEGPHNEPSLVIDKKLEVDDSLFFVAAIGEKVTGTIMGGYDGHRGWLYSLAVRPEYRSHGIGSALASHIEAVLSQKGCVKINLQILAANVEVRAFYESAGYIAEERLSMGKRLPENIPLS